MLRVFTWCLSRVRSDERGQGTIEYVLVMLAVTAVAVVLIAWARSGSGRSVLQTLFETVIGWVTARAKVG